MDFHFDPAKMAKGADAYSSSDSDSDEDNEAYRMPATDPVAGEFGDFNPRKRRRTGRNAKESAALGIFGSESEDDHSSRRWKQRKPLRKQGMSFVSSGAKAKASDDEDEDEDDDDDEESEEDGRFGLGSASRQAAGEEEEEDDEEEDDEAGGVGLGFGGASRAQGLGFEPASFQSRAKPPSFQPATTTASAAAVDAQNPLGHGFVPSSAYEPILRVQDQAPKKPPVAARPSAFSSKPAGRGGGGGSKFNPKSFGARMMAKMGYVEGEGLGKEGQGRNIIIEANLRPQGIGLGAVKEKSEKERQEEKRQARLRGEVVIDSDEEEKKIKAAAAARRRKAMVGGSGATSSGTSTPQRSKKKYMTMDEVKKAAPGLHIPEAFTPILDMTGPGRKMLTTSSGLMTPTSGAAGVAASPAAAGAGTTEETAEQAESRKVARRAQNDFMAILEEWQSLQNRKAFAELQAQQERQELAELEGNLQGHKVMTDAFARLSLLRDDADEWTQTWDRTIAQLKAAAETIPAASLSDMKDAMANISVAAIHPLFKQALDTWEPLKDSNEHIVDGLLSIQSLLGFGPDGASRKTLQGRETHHQLFPSRKRKSAATPYEAMIYKLWLPHMSAAVRQWDVVRDTDSMLAVYEAWAPVLPDFVRVQLLEQDIVRRLDEAVAKWEPKRRRSQSSQSQNLPHLWLFPWLQHLPERHLDPTSADGLVAEVKRKFRQLVDVWEFYRGVVPGLRQWKSVLRPSSGSSSSGGDSRTRADQWRPLVMSHVLPSMARYVRDQFRVDPRDQAPYLEVVTGEFQWLDLLAPEMIGEVMVAEVFPMWHETLYHLLTTPGLLTLEQVAQWFQWWSEEVFPSSLRRLPSIAAEFERGLMMINEALDVGGGVSTAYDPDGVGQLLDPPSKGPALKSSQSRHHNGSSHQHRHHHHDRQKHNTDQTSNVSAAATPNEPEEMSIRHYAEKWCEENDLQFIPERKKVHAEGRPLYRLTARGDGRGGVLVYFKGVRLYAETKKGPVEIRVDREEDWPKLLAMAQ